MRRSNRAFTHESMKSSLLLMLLFSTYSVIATEHSSESESLTPLQEEIQWLQEETYVSTATKTLESISKSGATVSVITAEDLKNMGARNLMDALKRVPGLGIKINKLGLPVIEVRGVQTEFSEKVLFLVNGHAINNNLVNGGATWAHNNFMIDEIKRVEIVRGPGSALYGANAFVAVINIITNQASDLNGSQVTLGIGDNETQKVNIQTGKTINDFAYAINANFFDTDMHREFVESDFWGNSGESNDWNKRYDLSFNMSVSNYTFQGKYLKRTSGPYIGFGNALNDESKQDYLEYFLELGYERSFSDTIQINSKVYYNNFKTKNFWEVHPEGFPPGAGFPDGFLGSSPITIESTGAEFQFKYAISQHKLLFGLMAEHQTLFDIGFEANFNPTTGTPLVGGYQDIYDRWPWIKQQSRDIQAVFLQDIIDIRSDLRLIIGARYDHYSDVGGSFNPRSSLSWEFTEGYNLVATYGSAFRAPNFGELHNANNPGAIGNPDLDPEEIETYEFSLNGKINKRTRFRVTGFRNNISDLIDFRNFIASNVGKLEINGAEIELSSRFRNGSTIRVNYTYQYACNKQSDQRVAEVPMHKANASYNYHHTKHLSSYIGLSHVGQAQREAGDSRSNVSDSTTVDIALNLQNTSQDVNIKASIYNLFNKQYFDPAPTGTVASDFPKPGRNLMVEVAFLL
ncbi:MAG: outer membrane cobalamin receptor [Oleiphilaceae bacterium]|jgi:outer membrane cobalamin receptor